MARNTSTLKPLTPMSVAPPAPAPEEHKIERLLFEELLMWKRKAEIADERAKRIADHFQKYRTRHALKVLARKLTEKQ